MPRSATSGLEADPAAVRAAAAGRGWRRPRPPARVGPPLRDRRGVRMALMAVVVFVAWFAWSMGHALTAPGGGRLSDRVAEWARDHYLGPLVTFGEWLTYEPPKVGGKPSFALTAPGSGQLPPRNPAVAKAAQGRQVRPVFPARLASPAGKPLPGEGHWRVLGSVSGMPAMFGTYLRPAVFAR